MKKLLSTVLLAGCALGMPAQVATVEESVTEIVCDDARHYTAKYREVVTIHNEKGKEHALFVCLCSKDERLTAFRGQAADQSGRIIRKMKQGELLRTEYSDYLAVDDYRMFLDYTPPTYPVTITYEWTMECRNTLVEFPRFCPQDDYDVEVKKATYQLTVPQTMTVRHSMQNITQQPAVTDDGKGHKTLRLELTDMPAISQEPYCLPLRERLPMGYFAPQQFVYYNTKGSLDTWADYGRWEYSLLDGRDQLPENIKAELHRMTDPLPTDREKVEAVYHFLGKTTRYVAVLLGIGGQQPAPAAEVAKSGFGDCKGLSNYMRAMLQEIGIPSYYTTISTRNRRLLKDFASVGQMNHVILQVPLAGDTLWVECTNPQLPLGYVHEDIAGHDAIEISNNGGRLVTLPVYADTANVLSSQVAVTLDAAGGADILLSQTARKWQYEILAPLLKMDDKERHKVMLHTVRAEQATIGRLDISERAGACLDINSDIRSQRYAGSSGKRLFVPICPVRHQHHAPSFDANRTQALYISRGWTDEDTIDITLPEGYTIESMPKSITMEQPFGYFAFTVKEQDGHLLASYRMTIKAGSYDKDCCLALADMIKRAASAYSQKMVIRQETLQ